MLRKHTNFFDDTLQHLDGNLTLPFDNARELSEKIVGLVQDISVTRTHSFAGEPGLNELTDIMNRFLDGMGCTFGQEEVQKFLVAAMTAYRLESIFRYPWEKHPSGATRFRRMVLTLKFFQKATSQPKYTMTFVFSADGESVSDGYGII